MSQAIPQSKPRKAARPRSRREHILSVRLERNLVDRLRYAAVANNTSPSDKVRIILDQALPQIA